MGAFLLTGSLGSYVASILVIIMRAASNGDWYPSKDPNQGHIGIFLLPVVWIDADQFWCFPVRCFLIQVQDCDQRKN